MAVPPVVESLARRRPVRPLWRNDAGGTTFAIGAPGTGILVKWHPAPSDAAHRWPVDLEAERIRLEWLAPHVRVPAVVGHGSDETGAWLGTELLDAETAVSPDLLADPGAVVAALGASLRSFHDRVPVEGCPFDWSVATRIADAAEIGVDPAASRALGPAPGIDRLVVCHGDACTPNVLLDRSHRFVAHIDVGACGVADRWADLAVATMSLGWNLGPGWEDALLDAYGIDPDPERTAFYRSLWDAT